jgi:DNA-binding response OmpR family regulator
MRSQTASPSAIVGRSLLVSRDPVTIEQLKVVIEQFAITADVCPDPSTAASLINTRKYEAIVVDMTLGKPGAELLERVRHSPSNQNSVTFALAASDELLPSRVGSHFFLRKPLNESSIKTALRAALGLIIRDYRRYFRCPASVPVVLSQQQGEPIRCEMMNISEGGMAVTAALEFHPGTVVTAEFALPDEPAAFTLRTEVCWCDQKGRIGLHFEGAPDDQKQRLQAWLSKRIEQGIPEPVARLFQNVDSARPGL